MKNQSRINRSWSFPAVVLFASLALLLTGCAEDEPDTDLGSSEYGVGHGNGAGQGKALGKQKTSSGMTKKELAEWRWRFAHCGETRGNGNGKGQGQGQGQGQMTCNDAGPGWDLVYDDPALQPLEGVYVEPVGAEVTIIGWQSPGNPQVGLFKQYNGQLWESDLTAPEATLRGVDGKGRFVAVAGTLGTLALRGANGGWYNVETNTKQDLNDVFVNGGLNMTAVGANGTIIEARGRNVMNIQAPTNTDLNGIWGIGGTVIVVGEGGTVFERQAGGSYTLNNDFGTQRDLNGIWGIGGTVIVVGELGTVISYDLSTETTTELNVPTRQDLNGIWGIGGTVIVVGDNGTIFANVGSGWVEGPNLTDQNLTGVWGTDLDNIFVVGDEGSVFRFGL